mgnify:CR=1 FL=1
MGGDESVFEQLSADHKTDLIALSSNNYRLVWHPNLMNAEGKVEMPKKLGVEQFITNNLLTDLVSGVDQAVASDAAMAPPTGDGATLKQRLFVVMFTDGQHNANTRPQDLARRLGNRRAEMHVVGVGTTRMPRDLVVLKVVAPGKVFPNTILSTVQKPLDTIAAPARRKRPTQRCRGTASSGSFIWKYSIKR